jgi:hypothetical protein
MSANTSVTLGLEIVNWQWTIGFSARAVVEVVDVTPFMMSVSKALGSWDVVDLRVPFMALPFAGKLAAQTAVSRQRLTWRMWFRLFFLPSSLAKAGHSRINDVIFLMP